MGEISNAPEKDGKELSVPSLTHISGGGLYTPVGKTGLNSTITTIFPANFQRTNNIVTVGGELQGTITTGGAGNPLTGGISIPNAAPSGNFTAIDEAIGLVHLRGVAPIPYPGNIEAIVGEKNIKFTVYGHGLASSEAFVLHYFFAFEVQ